MDMEVEAVLAEDHVVLPAVLYCTLYDVAPETVVQAHVAEEEVMEEVLRPDGIPQFIPPGVEKFIVDEKADEPLLQTVETCHS